MAGNRYIVEGDVHSHGGRVLAGAPGSRIDGKAIARVGDPAVCEIYGPTVIAPGSGNACPAATRYRNDRFGGLRLSLAGRTEPIRIGQ